MITIKDAFAKFLSRLELNDAEQADASRRQKEIRAYMDENFHVEDDFLIGSYRRWTKTKPLKDVDIFCVLGDDERHYRSKHPSRLLVHAPRSSSGVQTTFCSVHPKSSTSMETTSSRPPANGVGSQRPEKVGISSRQQFDLMRRRRA